MAKDQMLAVSAKRDHIEHQTKARTPTHAVAELVWNAFDADATKVEVSLERNKLDAIERIEIEDNGTGIDPILAHDAFQSLGGSWKRNSPRTRANRSMHGKMGKGRFKAFALGKQVVWDTVTRHGEQIVRFPIKITAATIDKVSIGDFSRLRQQRPTGTLTRIEGIEGDLLSLQREKAVDDLARIFALYLAEYPNVRLIYDGQQVDPSAAIVRQDDMTLGKVEVAPNVFVSAKLTVIEWRFCYVPSVSTIKQTPLLKKKGVADPDVEWGDYVFLRSWDEKKFRSSLREATSTPNADLNSDGNRAVMYCTTTDPYQVFRHPDAIEQRKLAEAAQNLVRRSLEIIRDESDLNVRILIRSPLARQDFDLFKSFGPRLMFGMSLPTLRNDLSSVYEPRAPAPSQRLRTLTQAKSQGLHIYVAVAPTYPECDEKDLRATLSAIAELKPLTVYHEPINIRAENVQRIAEHAKSLGIVPRTDVFATREAWKNYALAALKSVQNISKDVGLSKQLHLWPDRSLGSKWVVDSMPRPKEYQAWLERWWNRVSEWPKR